MIKRIFSSVILIFTIFFAEAQSSRQQWVDSVFNTLSETEKIGQLLMVPVSSKADDSKIEKLEKDINSGFTGNIFFTDGEPVRQLTITNKLQSTSKIPVLIAMHASEGLGRSLDSTLTFPDPLALGAIESDSMIYMMSKEIARELKLLGVHMNLGPTANLIDTTDNRINTNLYGEDPVMVSQKLLAELRGMQSEGIMSCATEFPVQGVTVTEFKKGMPSVQIFVDTLLTAPFRKLFANQVEAVMPIAKELPVFYQDKKTNKKNQFSSEMLSSFFTGDWLKRKAKYNGLVIIDIRGLEQVSGKARIADAELLAFKTGNDVIITDNNPSSAIRKIKKLLKKEKEYSAMLDNAVRRVLSAKYDAGLSKRTVLNSDNLIAKLNPPSARVLQHRLFNASITVVKNSQNALPVKSIENQTIASVIIGDSTGLSGYNRLIGKYVHAKKIFFNDGDSSQLNSVLKNYNIVIAAFSPNASKDLVNALSPVFKRTTTSEQQIIVADLSNPFVRKHLADFPAVISVFSNHPEAVKGLPQAIFGGISSSGVVPLTIGNIPPGSQTLTSSLKRFSYSFPEDAALSSKTLKQIESIAHEAIDMSATPGCYVFVARDGKVVYEKGFGYLTYEKKTPVTDSTIYDLASVTKVSATLQAVMFLYDRGMIDLNKKASFYLPELKNSNKEDFTVKDILTHQAGLWPFIPFYVQTMKDTSYIPGFYSRTPSPQYPRMVAEHLYTYAAMPDSLWHWAIKGKIREKPARTPFDYKYSDLGFYIMQHLSERLLNQPIDDFVSQNIYEPLGAYTTGYLPLLRFSATRIAPTENDKLFRKTLLIGTVHDPGAAMHGGVAGHAGLFSTANDLGKLGQMLLQEGYYGGYQYYKPETVRLFSQRQYDSNHRGLGWAKSIQSDPSSPTSLFASAKTFGHTGYTGTCIWMDPEFNLVYIFLSNRVHPEVSNKLLNANIRSRIQDVIYQSIFDYCKVKPVDQQLPEKMTASKKQKQ